MEVKGDGERGRDPDTNTTLLSITPKGTERVRAETGREKGMYMHDVEINDDTYVVLKQRWIWIGIQEEGEVLWRELDSEIDWRDLQRMQDEQLFMQPWSTQ